MRAEGDVRRVELQVEALRVERARADSQHVAKVDSVRALLAAVQERLAAQQAYLVQLRGDVKTDLLAVQQQLVSVQELTGQSQQRLTELRGRLEEQAASPSRRWTRAAAARPCRSARRESGGPGPEQMYDLAYQQYRASRYGTARQPFESSCGCFRPRAAPDALYFIGESFAGENADSAAAVYQQVVKTYPASPRHRRRSTSWASSQQRATRRRRGRTTPGSSPATPALQRPTSRATSSSAWGGSLSRVWAGVWGAGVSETRENRGEMPFLDHVEELRWRILKSLVAVLLDLVGWVVVEHVDVIRMLMRPIIPLLPDGKLKFTSPTSRSSSRSSSRSPWPVARVTGGDLPTLGVPHASALLPREAIDRARALRRRVLFLSGAGIAFEWLLPHILRMLFSFQPQVFSPIITADDTSRSRRNS